MSSVAKRVEVAGCPQLTYLSSSPSQFPIYIALNFVEPSIKPTQVEPKAGAIIASCDGAVNGTEKQRGEMYAPFSTEVENIDPSLNH